MCCAYVKRVCKEKYTMVRVGSPRSIGEFPWCLIWTRNQTWNPLHQLPNTTNPRKTNDLKKKRSRNHSLVRTKTGTRIPEVSKKAGYRTAAYKTPHRCLFSPRAGPCVWVLPYHPFSGHGCLLDFQQPSYEKVIDTPENHSKNKELWVF